LQLDIPATPTPTNNINNTSSGITAAVRCNGGGPEGGHARTRSTERAHGATPVRKASSGVSAVVKALMPQQRQQQQQQQAEAAATEQQRQQQPYVGV
jgi:hypothetical protein